MKKLLYVASNELLLLFKDKMAVVWMLILPLGLTAIMGLAFGGLGGGSDPVVIDLPVVDQDGGEMAAAVLDILAQMESLHLETEYDEETARQLVSDGERAGALVIPAGFTADVTSSNPTALDLLVAPGGQTAPLLEGMVRGITSGFSNVQTAVEVTISEVQRATGSYDLDYEGITARVVATTQERLENPPVGTHVTTVGSAEEEEFNIFDQVVPGYAVMFAMFGVLSGAGGLQPADALRRRAERRVAQHRGATALRHGLFCRRSQAIQIQGSLSKYWRYPLTPPVTDPCPPARAGRRRTPGQSVPGWPPARSG